MPDRYENRKFENQVVQLDGNQYIRCTFQGCTLQYGGSEIPTLKDNEFNRCKWEFTDAAERTIKFMIGLYRGAGEGGRELIEQTFKNIRRG